MSCWRRPYPRSQVLLATTPSSPWTTSTSCHGQTLTARDLMETSRMAPRWSFSWCLGLLNCKPYLYDLILLLIFSGNKNWRLTSWPTWFQPSVDILGFSLASHVLDSLISCVIFLALSAMNLTNDTIHLYMCNEPFTYETIKWTCFHHSSIKKIWQLDRSEKTRKQEMSYYIQHETSFECDHKGTTKLHSVPYLRYWSTLLVIMCVYWKASNWGQRPK